MFCISGETDEIKVSFDKVDDHFLPVRLPIHRVFNEIITNLRIFFRREVDFVASYVVNNTTIFSVWLFASNGPVDIKSYPFLVNKN